MFVLSKDAFINAPLPAHPQCSCMPPGSTTPCRMTRVTLQNHVHYEEIQARTCSGPLSARCLHQQPEVNYFARFSLQLISVQGNRRFREPGYSSHDITSGARPATSFGECADRVREGPASGEKGSTGKFYIGKILFK